MRARRSRTPSPGLARQCAAGDVRLVRFLYCGNDGVIRGKACHTKFLDSYLASGIGLTVAMQSFNVLDQLAPDGAFGTVGEIRLVPDVRTFAVLPTCRSPRASSATCSRSTGSRGAPAPGSFLKRTIERGRRAGLELQATFENEFTLARRDGEGYAPLDRSPCFSTIGMDSATPVMIEVIEALTAQGVDPEQYYAELGPGQQELPVRLADALRAADNQITVRETARGVALRSPPSPRFPPRDRSGRQTMDARPARMNAADIR